MIFKKTGALCAVLVIASAVVAVAGEGVTGAPPIDAADVLLQRGEQLWIESRYVDSQTALEKALELRPGDPEILWRLARNRFGLGQELPISQSANRVALFEETEHFARKCIEAAPNDGECHFWLGAALGRQTTSKGIFSAALAAHEIFTSFLKSVMLGLTYQAPDGRLHLSYAYYALGHLYRLTPDFWIVSTLVRVRGDMQKSVDCFRKASDLEPNRIEYKKELGVSLVCLGQKRDMPDVVKEGRTYLELVRSSDATSPSDEIERRHAALLLEHPNLCCSYSRDGQIAKEAAGGTSR